ncbi:tetratricopeptide repeat protein [Parabacteroides sp. PF5-6]|uniref:tetratricopeptide repeat protein n=1 Tax=Parabacteroides sp. PF5-6 TaxID=1742403 RepID=UPI0024070C3F|nr:tetratricopeptide repeat protein [Parabacteroides sp. PF5-6]MDF9830926.1 tetratricopeptide (TPR) repeat protein [Parabacteroides sp. PF5-6]
MGIFSSLFSSSKKEETQEDKQQNGQKNFDILKYDGVRALQIRQVKYAIRCFEEALNIQKDPETMTFLISAYSMAQDTESALETADELIELEPENTDALLTRVNLYFMADRDKDAIADCDRVIELDEMNFLAWILRAKAKRATGDWEGAVADVTRSMAIKENFADGYLLRAQLYLAMKKGEEALDDVNQVIALVEEGEETAHLLRGQIYELLGDQDAALQEYQEVLALNPFNEEAYLLAARQMIGRQKYPEALALYDEAIEHNEQFARAYTARGQLKEQMGDAVGAAQDLQIAAELEPEAGTKEQADFDNLYKGGIF